MTRTASTRQTPPYQASTASARASFFALALVVTVGLLGAVGQQADRSYDQALLAQAGAPALAAATQAASAGLPS